MTMRLSTMALVLALAACDSASTEEPSLVLEAYFQPGQSLPPVRVSRTVGVSEARVDSPVSGAEVEVSLGGQIVLYSEEQPGLYRPRDHMHVDVGDTFSLRVAADGGLATASGVVPPPIRLDSLRVTVPEESVAAVLVDSLNLQLDSLAFEVPSRTGYIYPVDVQLWWQPARGAQDYWIETSLEPVQEFSSRLIDFFLLPSSVLEESSDGPDQLSWTGLYAVPVADESAPLPPHFLKVAAVRSTLDYARFALSRRDPDQREPVSNVSGGLGIVAGIALDSVRVYVQ